MVKCFTAINSPNTVADTTYTFKVFRCKLITVYGPASFNAVQSGVPSGSATTSYFPATTEIHTQFFIGLGTHTTTPSTSTTTPIFQSAVSDGSVGSRPMVHFIPPKHYQEQIINWTLHGGRAFFDLSHAMRERCTRGDER